MNMSHVGVQVQLIGQMRCAALPKASGHWWSCRLHSVVFGLLNYTPTRRHVIKMLVWNMFVTLLLKLISCCCGGGLQWTVYVKVKKSLSGAPWGHTTSRINISTQMLTEHLMQKAGKSSCFRNDLGFSYSPEWEVQVAQWKSPPVTLFFPPLVF